MDFSPFQILIVACALTISGILLLLILGVHRVQRMQLDKQRQLAEAIISTQKLEQKRIGQNLHDHICPNLAAASLRLEVLGSATKNLDTIHELSRVTELILNTNVELQRILKKLCPRAIEHGQFNVALEEYAALLNHSQCNLTILKNDPLEGLSPFDFEHLYMVCKELIYNAYKHAQATLVEISLSQGSRYFDIRIQDNGKGLPANSKYSKGLGIKGIKTRLSIIGAQLQTQSIRESGTLQLIRLNHVK